MDSSGVKSDDQHKKKRLQQIKHKISFFLFLWPIHVMKLVSFRYPTFIFIYVPFLNYSEISNTLMVLAAAAERARKPRK